MTKKWLWMLALVVAASVLSVAPAYPQTEPPECSDGVDNDNDGYTDFPDDSDCENPEDTAERMIGESPGDTVTIRYFRKAGAFKGEMFAYDQECRERRRVVLRRATPRGSRIIARTFTDARYQWKVYWPDAKGGRYFAVALRAEVVRPDGPTLICERDRSVTIRVRD